MRYRTRRLVRGAPGPDPAAAASFARWTRPIPPTVAADPPGPTVVLLNDTRDQISVGSKALTDGLIRILRGRLPDATLVPIPSHWLVEPSAFGAFENGGADFRVPAAAFPRLADQFETIADDWQAGRGGAGVQEYVGRMLDADLVVLNGEGSLYRTNVSAIRELFLAWFCKVRLGVPTVYLNGGLHLTGVMPILPAMVRKTFPALDAVAVRDPWSFRNLQEYLPDLAASLVPDAAYAFTPDDARESDAVKAIADRIGGAPYFCFDPGAMPMDTVGGARSALHTMITELQEIVPQAVFVSHSPPDDYVASIAEATGSVYVDTVREYRDFLALVRDAEFVVTGRHHNVILASIVGCPSVAFGATTHKVHGVCEWLEGLVGSAYDGTDLRTQMGPITAQAGDYVDRRDEIRTGLLEVTGRLRAQTSALGDLAAAHLRGGARPSARLGDGTR